MANAQNNAEDFCMICGLGKPMKWPQSVVRSDGAKCTDMALNMAELVSGSGGCLELQQQYRDKCCFSQTPPAAVAVAPTPAPVVANQGSGSNPTCDICVGGGVPSDKSMVINMLYLWEGTCMSYYEDGLKGNIPRHMCAPLQFFGAEPCGCRTSQAPPSTSSGGGGSTSSGGGSTGSSTLSGRKVEDDEKANQSLVNGRGGSAGGGRRGLKGFQGGQ